MAHSRLEEMEELQIEYLVLNMLVLSRLVHGRADMVRVVHRRLWVQTDPSSLSNRASSYVAHHQGCCLGVVAS